jgi:hypothetical protein
MVCRAGNFLKIWLWKTDWSPRNYHCQYHHRRYYSRLISSISWTVDWIRQWIHDKQCSRGILNALLWNRCRTDPGVAHISCANKICNAPIELLIVIISYKNSFKGRLDSVPMHKAMARCRTIASDPVKSMDSGDTVHVRYLIPWNRFFIEKLIVTHLVKLYPTSYGTKIH